MTTAADRNAADFPLARGLTATRGTLDGRVVEVLAAGQVAVECRGARLIARVAGGATVAVGDLVHVFDRRAGETWVIPRSGSFYGSEGTVPLSDIAAVAPANALLIMAGLDREVASYIPCDVRSVTGSRATVRPFGGTDVAMPVEFAGQAANVASGPGLIAVETSGRQHVIGRRGPIVIAWSIRTVVERVTEHWKFSRWVPVETYCLTSFAVITWFPVYTVEYTKEIEETENYGFDTWSIVGGVPVVDGERTIFKAGNIDNYVTRQYSVVMFGDYWYWDVSVGIGADAKHHIDPSDPTFLFAKNAEENGTLVVDGTFYLGFLGFKYELVSNEAQLEKYKATAVYPLEINPIGGFHSSFWLDMTETRPNYDSQNSYVPLVQPDKQPRVDGADLYAGDFTSRDPFMFEPTGMPDGYRAVWQYLGKEGDDDLWCINVEPI